MDIQYEKIKRHIKDNILIYLILLIFFIIGIVLGSYIMKTYTEEEEGILNNFLKDSITIYSKEDINYNNIFKSAFNSSAKEVLILWLLGFTVIGFPFILFIIGKSGFILGFLSGAFINNFGIKGAFLSVILIFSKSFIFIPLIFFLATKSIELSTIIISIIRGKSKYKINIKNYMFSYLVLLSFSVAVIIIYSFFETYFSSNILKWAIGLT